MNISKINLEHHGMLHVPSKYVDLFRKYDQIDQKIDQSGHHFSC
jgi:hypothetical protein